MASPSGQGFGEGLVDADPGGDPHAAAEAAELRRDLAAAMLELPFKYRAAVVLRHVIGLDYAEAAREMDVPLNTFKSHLLRGTKLLREALADRLQPDVPDRPPLAVPGLGPARAGRRHRRQRSPPGRVQRRRGATGPPLTDPRAAVEVPQRHLRHLISPQREDTASGLTGGQSVPQNGGCLPTAQLCAADWYDGRHVAHASGRPMRLTTDRRLPAPRWTDKRPSDSADGRPGTRSCSVTYGRVVRVANGGCLLRTTVRGDWYRWPTHRPRLRTPINDDGQAFVSGFLRSP